MPERRTCMYCWLCPVDKRPSLRNSRARKMKSSTTLSVGGCVPVLFSQEQSVSTLTAALSINENRWPGSLLAVEHRPQVTSIERHAWPSARPMSCPSSSVCVFHGELEFAFTMYHTGDRCLLPFRCVLPLHPSRAFVANGTLKALMV